jgi:hypothetical protein
MRGLSLSQSQNPDKSVGSPNRRISRNDRDADAERDVVVETAADRATEEPSEEALMAYSGGRDAVREPVMRGLRAAIREHQMRGVSIEKIHDWIDRREAVGEISEEEGAIGRLIARHYTEVVWDAIYPASIGA